MRRKSLLGKLPVFAAVMLAVIMLLPLTATGCGKVAVAGVTLNETAIELTVGGKSTLTATVTPGDAEDKSVTWSSSDETIAAVTQDGEVTAVKAGRATVTVTTTDGKKTADCVVTVTAAPAVVVVESVTLNETQKTLYPNDTFQLTATVLPANATNKKVIWSSGDKDTVSVSSAGLVTAKAVKNTPVRITATTEDGKKTATCEITVTAAPAVVAVESVTLNETRKTLGLNDTFQLTATVLPANATNKKVNWSSSNDNIASVSSAGLVTAKMVASTPVRITATTEDGKKTASCAVTIKILAKSVTLDKTAQEISVGGTFDLTATITPADVTEPYVIFESEKESVATVVQKGETTATVTGVGAGTAKITATTADGNKTAACTVTVTSASVAVTGVSLNKTSAALTVGNTETLAATVQPADATNKAVTWSSGDENVATVNDNGEVTAVGSGTTTITVTTVDGSKTAACTVTVGIGATNVALDRTALKMKQGTEVTLTATITPAGADKTVSWTSDNEAVATVDGGGVVTAIAPGTATITAATASGVSATCTVTVDNSVVTTWEELKTALGKNENITLGADIDAAGEAYSPTLANYTKVFDGQNFTISNLTVTATAKEYGMFKKLTNGTVKNVRFESPVVNGGNFNAGGLIAGSIAGVNAPTTAASTLENITINGMIFNGTNAERGLLMGNIYGSGVTLNVIGCRVSGTIKDAQDAAGYRGVGGIIGLVNYGSTLNVTDCDVDVTADNGKGKFTGGAVGMLATNAHLTATGSSFAVSVKNSRTGQSYVGGVIGGIDGGDYYYQSKISESTVAVDDCVVYVNAVEDTLSGLSVGGIVGVNDNKGTPTCSFTVTDSFVKMSLGSTKRAVAGPIIGKITNDNITVKNTIVVADPAALSATDGSIYGDGTALANEGAGIVTENLNAAADAAAIDDAVAALLTDETANPDGFTLWTYDADTNTLTFRGSVVTT